MNPDHQRPDIFPRPAIRDVRLLEFYRFEKIYRQAAPEQARLERELEARLGRR